ncbi:DIX domain containing protein [Nitzschia inconspicua]|uniref:DIX domain containing protein n=1 Tax=Nitzschia inconspicua TaxID=303405 RepID=A0A9K3P8Q7_9STRA|nr:DIX domain containing protein [Nitzschia inconspicua]KAG7365946.1 DIX domain containing protein [Nitzschia inconspicua]
MTTIRYFIPEDGDSEMQPNVFLAPKPRHPGAPPTFGQLKDAFPLPGQYHFRFKAPLAPGTDREKGAMAVWMDVVDERQPVPTWQNGIIVKVTRVSMEDDDDDDDDDDHHHHHNNTHHHTPAPQRHHAPAPAPQPSRAPPAHSTSIASTGSAASVDDLFGSPPVPAAPTSGGSLLDFNDHASTPAPAAAHADFLGMMAPTHGTPAPPPPQAPQSGGYPGNPNMYGSQTQQPQQQQQPFNTSYTQQQQQGGAFGGLGTPWK